MNSVISTFHIILKKFKYCIFSRRDLVFDSNGLAKKGVLVRHLVMPSYVDEGKSILSFLAKDVSKDTYVNLMEQYRPTFKVGEGENKAFKIVSR